MFICSSIKSLEPFPRSFVGRNPVHLSYPFKTGKCFETSLGWCSRLENTRMNCNTWSIRKKEWKNEFHIWFVLTHLIFFLISFFSCSCSGLIPTILNLEAHWVSKKHWKHWKHYTSLSFMHQPSPTPSL